MKLEPTNEKATNTTKSFKELRVFNSREELEEARLREAIFASDTEKFRKFCTMMRIGKVLASANITHK